MVNAIETQDLSKRFGRTRAVDGLTLAVPAGSIFAFLGANGAGKTTTIKMLMDIVHPSSGTATVLGVDSRRLGPGERAQIGYVSENQSLPGWMTAATFLRFCRGFYPTWDESLAERLSRSFALPPDTRLRDLSRGMKMKAALLSSIAYRPRLLVLDEPFTGLDVLVREELVRGMLELAENDGWTVFVSSHDIDEVERLADWVGILSAGRLQLAEPSAALQARMRRVEVTAPEGMLSAEAPASWLGFERAGQRVTFVESEYREGATEAAVRAHFGGAGEITISPLSLRESFAVLARAYDLAGGKEAA